MRALGWVAVAAVGVATIGALNVYRTHHDSDSLRPTPSVRSSAVAVLPINSTRCGDWPGMSVQQEASIPFPSPAKPDRRIISVRCTDINGQRRPSLILLADRTSRSSDLVAGPTLLDESLDAHFVHATVAGDAVTVQVSYWGQPSAAANRPKLAAGTVIEQQFTLNQAGDPVAGPIRPVAAPCTAADLKVALVRGPASPTGGAARGAWLLQFTNRAQLTCAVEGYPNVQPRQGLALVGRTYQSLSGQLGGVTHSTVPPTVLLPPAATATAVLEPSPGVDPALGRCNVDRIVVGPPTGDPSVVFPLALGWCSSDVHPIVAGTTGSA